MITVTVCNFYTDKIYYFIETKVLKQEYVIASPNDYFVKTDFNYVENFTDDPSNYFELINYIYYIINTGVSYADGECKMDCIIFDIDDKTGKTVDTEILELR